MSEHKPKFGGIALDDVQITDLSNLKERPTTVPKGGNVQRVGGQNIVTVEIPKEQTVSSFEPGRIRDSKGIRYSDVAKGMTANDIRSSRFQINALTRGPLAVEAEEEARIWTEVQARLTAKIEEMRAETTTRAHELGYAAGRELGRAEVLAAGEPKLQDLASLAQVFNGMAGEIFKANEQFLMHLVYQLAKAVLLREIKGDKEYTLRLATHILDRLGTRENIKIFVSPGEISSAESIKEGLAQTLGQLKNISIEVDPSIQLAGCRVETEFGEIDGRIEVQLQSIAATIDVAGAAT